RPVDSTARLDLDADHTARLDPARPAVRPSVPTERSGRQNDVSLRDALRVRRGGAAVRRARPVDSTARLDLDADHTTRLDLGRGVLRPSGPPERSGRQKGILFRDAL